MRVIAFFFILFCLNCKAQIIYFSSGLGSNPGASSYPYTGASYLSIPKLLEAEIKLELKECIDVSIFGRKNFNKKGGDSFLSGTSTRVLSHYLGLKLSEPLIQSHDLFNRSFGIGCSFAFGEEEVMWNDDLGSFLGSSSELSGQDEFKYLQAGIYSFLNWEKSQLNFKLTLGLMKDFILYHSRYINNSSAYSDLSKYEKHESKGLFSFNIQGGVGFRFFN